MPPRTHQPDQDDLDRWAKLRQAGRDAAHQAMSDAPDQVTDPLGFAAFKAGFDGVARDDAPLFTALSHAVQQRRFWADIAAAIDTTIPAIDSWYRIRRAKLGERS